MAFNQKFCGSCDSLWQVAPRASFRQLAQRTVPCWWQMTNLDGKGATYDTRNFRSRPTSCIHRRKLSDPYSLGSLFPYHTHCFRLLGSGPSLRLLNNLFGDWGQRVASCWMRSFAIEQINLVLAVIVVPYSRFTRYSIEKIYVSR